MSHIPFCLQKQDQYIMPEANSLLPLSSNPLLLAWLDDSVATSCTIPLPADTLLDFVGRGRWRDRASESREREKPLFLVGLLFFPRQAQLLEACRGPAGPENWLGTQWTVPCSPALLANCTGALARDTHTPSAPLCPPVKFSVICGHSTSSASSDSQPWGRGEESSKFLPSLGTHPQPWRHFTLSS